MPFELNIGPLADDVPFSNVLLYGDSGAGKTVFCGSDLKVLFLAPEDSGTLSALRMGSKADKATIRCLEDLKNAVDYLYDHPEVCEQYDWLAIDSLTEMQYMVKDYVLRMGKASKVSKGHDPEKMQLEDYGSMHTLLENLVRSINDLPMNVIYTATAKKVEGAGGEEFLVPDIQGKKEYGIAMKMAALMTSYGYIRTEIHAVPVPVPEGQEAQFKNVKRRVIYWEDTGEIRGKDRTISLAPFTVNATLQQVRRAMKGDLVRAKDGKLVKPNASGVAPEAAAPVVVKVETSKPKPDDDAKTEESKASPDQPTDAKVEPKEETKATAEVPA